MNNSDKNTTYEPFNTFVFRTPHISFHEFEENMKRLQEDENYWKEFIQNSCIQEAIFLGTPILYEEIQKYLSGTLTTPKEIEKLKLSVLRYYTRMSTRCTPFGLFAGLSLGQLGDKSDIELVDSSQYTRYTRLDMNYLCNLAQDIGKQKEIREHLHYFPNSSMYPLGERLRYVEYYFQNAKRIHNITAVDNSEYLELILQNARSGAKIATLANLIIDEDITLDEATDFIHELINSQLLVSELEPAITGKDFLIQLSDILQRIPQNEELNENFFQLSSILSKIDTTPIGNTLNYYHTIENIVKELKIPYELKFLFQADMLKPVKQAVLDKQIIEDVKDALELMNKISLSQTETLLSKFAEDYYERYEDKEMPLLQALDTEAGIGYKASPSDLNPLLNGFALPMQQSNSMEVKWNRIQSILHKKFLEAHKNSAYSIEIEEKDFAFLKANWDDLPPTISCMCEVFSTKEDDYLLLVHGSGGSSAANLLGRFCHIDQSLENYTNKITNYEQSLSEDIIYAEIVHLPESRIGNILLRPVLRSYEIPYLAKSAVKEEQQIPLSDLYVSVKGRKVFLRSKRLNKEVVPRMSTAHNFSFNAMPVYHFLCNLQTQGVRGGIGFYWGSLANEYEFLPRVKYKKSILYLATWIVKTEDFKKLVGLSEKDKKDTPKITEDFTAWVKEKQLPRYVVLPDGDNDLFVDLESTLSLQVLYSVIKKRPSFQLEEFPFDKENAIVREQNGKTFTNEFLFGFYKSEKQ